MVFGAAYSHTDILKMGYSRLNSFVIICRLSSSSTLITAPPTAVNNLTIPTSYSDFMDQTDDGTAPHRTPSLTIVDWALSIDDSDNGFVLRRSRSKPPSSIEHRAEPPQPTRTNITYPVISPPTPSIDGIKPHANSLVKGSS
jgi:hypothetical protein